MRNLVKDVWKEFNELKNEPMLKDKNVIVDTMPILYFGNLDAYKKSKLKIVTVSLNPSDMEFKKKKSDKDYDFFRFPQAKELYGKAELKDSEVDVYISCLNEYFKTNYYKDWFDDNRLVLFKGLNASYIYDEEDTKQGYNVPLHIDMATPIATFPTWGKLGDEKYIFMEKEKDTWKKLIELLSPDIMLMSLDTKYIKEVDNKLYKCLKNNETEYKEIGNIRSKRYLTCEYMSDNGKIIKVMNIITANKAFQFTRDGVGYCEFAKILEKWKGEILCQE